MDPRQVPVSRLTGGKILGEKKCWLSFRIRFCGGPKYDSQPLGPILAAPPRPKGMDQSLIVDVSNPD
jgi:hypothetical protein